MTILAPIPALKAPFAAPRYSLQECPQFFIAGRVLESIRLETAMGRTLRGLREADAC